MALRDRLRVRVWVGRARARAERHRSARGWRARSGRSRTGAPKFLAALANVQFLTSRGSIPGSIVVGIPDGTDRTHDLTPAPTGKTAKDFANGGGADAFADFIADEVLPIVRAKYRARPMPIFAGHSVGGLIALHIAATRPSTYTGIVAMKSGAGGARESTT